MLIGLITVGAGVNAAPAPIDTHFADSEVLIALPDAALTTGDLPSNPEQLADRVRQQIDEARATGDPRFYGYATRALQQWQGPMTDRLLVLRATVQQSLHNFDNARRDLSTVISRAANARQTAQAILLLANLETVQGNYGRARQHCEDLQNRMPGLIAASCLAQVDARTGNAPGAYRALAGYMVTVPSDRTSQLWAEGTLGEIAAQLGMPEAVEHWQNVLEADPDDLYTRAQLVDWLIRQQQFDRALALTSNYEQVDALAVLRAIAMRQSGHPEADDLTASLDERFAEARWRGNLLHARDIARFELDVKGNAQAAVSLALDNWQEQREPADTRLLLRAAEAAGSPSSARLARAWLAKQHQADVRYPEEQP
ncbi:tetratricopeptide repeat protein [Marinobacter gudaonensis]|uniref:tetratricopeptide repeat protein n=1 Tax=Marinobacter gudaonensis TaxID=375760 RepID=UPI000B25ED86|nr:hypothetical protein [Marinobacter gudaonensis]